MLDGQFLLVPIILIFVQIKINSSLSVNLVFQQVYMTLLMEILLLERKELMSYY